MQLQGLREQLREKDLHLANVRTQVEEQKLLRTDFRHQLGEIVAENANLRQQVVNLENHTGSQPQDWVIPRDDIQLIDKSLGVEVYSVYAKGKELVKTAILFHCFHCFMFSCFFHFILQFRCSPL